MSDSQFRVRARNGERRECLRALLVIAASCIVITASCWLDVHRLAGRAQRSEVFSEFAFDSLMVALLATYVLVRGTADVMAILVPLPYWLWDTALKLHEAIGGQQQLRGAALAVTVILVLFVVMGTIVNIGRFVLCKKWVDGTRQRLVYILSVLGSAIPTGSFGYGVWIGLRS